MLSISVFHLLYLSASARILSSSSDLCPQQAPSSYQDYGYSNSDSYSSSNNDDANQLTSWSPDYASSLPSCDSADENAHGLYSSNLAPCEISFHKSSVKADINETEDPFQLLSPEACTDNNRVALSGSSKAKSFRNHVTNWKDECVADFTRCYSLAANKDIYRSLVCRKNWTIPTGATHMSVNCTKDMQLKQAAIAEYKKERNDNYNNNANDPLLALQDKQMKADSKRWHEMEAIMSTILAVLVLSCFCFSIVVYWCMVKPYMAFSRAAKRSEIEGLMTDASESKHISFSSNSRGGMHQAEIA